MKILEPSRINLGDARPVQMERNPGQSASFQKIMNSYSKELSHERLQGLLKEIDKQGQQLSEHRTFNELRKYKELVKEFMGEAAKHGVGLHQAETWDFHGGSKTLKTIQLLDRKLIELTDHVLDQQRSSLEILEKIGEIKGLLINLYT